MSIETVHAALTSDCISNLIKFKARHLLRRPEFHGVELEEVQQELALHVAQKAHLFDPKRGHVVAFIRVVVDTAAAIMCRSRRRLKRGPGLRVQSLEGSALLNEGEEMSLLDRLVEDDLHRHHGGQGSPDPRQQDARIDLADALERLSPRLRQVAQLLMNDGCEASIARDLRMSRRQVRKAIKELPGALSAVRPC
jgi:RNA polymerase sigma factor (sigma-70 family)